MNLTATKDFTDRQGQSRRKDEQFDVHDEKEAQEYIRQGHAREAQPDQSAQGQQRPERR